MELVKSENGGFLGLVIEETLSVNGGEGVEVIDLGRKGRPRTWIRFSRGNLYILGGDENWHEIDVEYALIFWQAREIEKRYLAGMVG